MEVVIYLILLLTAFGAGVWVARQYGLSTKFVSHRQLDKVLAEQRSLNNVMDEELVIVERQHRQELERFDRQLNPPPAIAADEIQLPNGAHLALPAPGSNQGPTVANDTYFARYVEQYLRQNAGNPYYSMGDRQQAEQWLKEYARAGIITNQTVSAPHDPKRCSCENCAYKRQLDETVRVAERAAKAKQTESDLGRRGLYTGQVFKGHQTLCTCPTVECWTPDMLCKHCREAALQAR